MTPRQWPIKLWTIEKGGRDHTAFLVDVNGKPTVPALFPTRKDALAAIGKRSGMRPLRVNVTVQAVSK